VHANKIQKQVVEEEYEEHNNCNPYKQAFLNLEMIVLLNHVQIQKTTKRKAKKEAQASNDIGNENQPKNPSSPTRNIKKL
jgi:hypothetical protein